MQKSQGPRLLGIGVHYACAMSSWILLKGGRRGMVIPIGAIVQHQFGGMIMTHISNFYHGIPSGETKLDVLSITFAMGKPSIDDGCSMLAG